LTRLRQYHIRRCKAVIRIEAIVGRFLVRLEKWHTGRKVAVIIIQSAVRAFLAKRLLLSLSLHRAAARIQGVFMTFLRAKRLESFIVHRSSIVISRFLHAELYRWRRKQAGVIISCLFAWMCRRREFRRCVETAIRHEAIHRVIGALLLWRRRCVCERKVVSREVEVKSMELLASVLIDEMIFDVVDKEIHSLREICRAVEAIELVKEVNDDQFTPQYSLIESQSSPFKHLRVKMILDDDENDVDDGLLDLEAYVRKYAVDESTAVIAFNEKEIDLSSSSSDNDDDDLVLAIDFPSEVDKRITVDTPIFDSPTRRVMFMDPVPPAEEVYSLP
jgi:hypothetical protein